MEITYESLKKELRDRPRRWLVTGVAGFIGSNLLESLLKLGQSVTGLDNFSTGHRHNLDHVRSLVTPAQWGQFALLDGDIRDAETCKRACENADYVLHQAALGSVSRSVSDPGATHENNVTGFLEILTAARDAKVRKFVYASSSSVYGDHPALPKIEAEIGACLSPYAVSKRVNELYADVFSKNYGLQTIGLRYFNVFGPRQDPNGVYAAVIPRWFSTMIQGKPVEIYGDGETSRDFCFVDNAVQANLLAAASEAPEALNQVYNVSVGDRTTLNQLFQLIGDALKSQDAGFRAPPLVYKDFRVADVRHSQADISKAERLLGFSPSFRVAEGLALSARWYRSQE